MKARGLFEPLRTIDDPKSQTPVEKVTGRTSRQVLDNLAIEEPLEMLRGSSIQPAIYWRFAKM